MFIQYIAIFNYFKMSYIFLVIVITVFDYRKHVFYVKGKHSIPWRKTYMKEDEMIVIFSSEGN